MTVPVPGSLVYTYSADDSTTSFAYPVRFLDKAEIVVILREGVTDTVQVLGTDYTISGSSWPTGGSIVFGTAPASGKTVVIYRNTVAKQLVDLENTQRNDANAVETQLDRLAMVQQDHGRKLEGTWQTRPGETAGTIQSVDDGHILVSDGNGNLVDGGAKSDLASAEQGELADTAVQPGDAEALPTDGTVGQILVRDPDAAAGRKWSSVAAGVGDMLSTAYDPAGKGDQVLTVTDAPSDPDLSTDTDKLALRGDVRDYTALDLKFDPDTNGIATKNSSDFSLMNPVIKFGENLSGYDSWVNATPDPQGYNVEGLSVDLGGYGPTSYGSYSAVSGITGKIKVPVNSNFMQVNAVAGEIISNSGKTNPVALYGQTTLNASNAGAWGGNSGVSAGAEYEGNTLIGWEFDVTVKNAKNTAIGLFVIGASSVRADGSLGRTKGVQVSPIGAFQTPPIPWDIAYFATAGAAAVFAAIYPKLYQQASRSQKIEWYYGDASGVTTLGPSCDVDTAGAMWHFGAPNGGATYWQNYVAGTLKTVLASSGNSFAVGNGADLSYNFNVKGTSKLDGAVGFQGSNPIAKPAVTGSVAGNAALASLLTALASYGLITNSTTT